MAPKSWEEFYNSLTIEEHLKNLSRHRFLIANVLKKNPKKVLEIGIGTGSISIFLSKTGIETIGIDNNLILIKNAKKNAKKLNADMKFILSDGLMEIPLKDEIDVAFSQGVAEHFTNNQIKTFVNNQLDVSKSVILSIPSKYYFKSYGDERLLPITEWQEIFQEFNISTICYYGVEKPPSWKFVFKKAASLKPFHIIKPHHIFIEITR